MFTPKLNKSCTNCKSKILHGKVKHICGIGAKTTYYVDFWYCPICGLTFYFKEHIEVTE